ncbi:hypothetical protein ACHAXA_011859 [Cyclostephanos tholiformis]|uniref:Exportin-4 n=1 Tax=Cyclostephanos tholiformis TaxID=382380 RepID=A0ABD3RH19_9STRA
MEVSAHDELRLVLSSPPPDWRGGRDKISILHASLEGLRDAGDPRYLFPRTLLEGLSSSSSSSSSSPSVAAIDEELLFHCAIGLRHTSLLRWECLLGSSSSSARYNMPLEFHRSCHRLFENGSDDVVIGVNCSRSGLDAALRSSMTALSCLVGHVLGDDGAFGDESLLELGSSIIDVTCGVLSWEFCAHGKWDAICSDRGIAGTQLRLPQRWRETLINPEFLGAMINVYVAVRRGMMTGHVDPSSCGGNSLLAKQGELAHRLRQLLLLLSSISAGPIFASEDERGAYARFLLDGSLDVLESIMNEQRHHQYSEEGSFASDLRSAEIVDFVTILSRLTANFRVIILSKLPAFSRYLSALCTLGEWLLESSLAECQRVEGDVESMEGVDWKNDALAQILHCSDAMAGDFWLVSGSADGQEVAVNASQALASILAPLYGRYCMCRVRMSCLEEHFAAREGSDLDEIREEISAFGMEEEMASVASLGRLNVLASMTTLSEMFRQCTPRLMSFFEMIGTDGDMTPDMAALLEESRMLMVCACHLLTDDCVGETPAIPESVINACQPRHGAASASCLSLIASLIAMLTSVAESQATKVEAYPANPCLSPLLAKTLLWFFRRWAPTYILPSSDEYRENSGGILSAYANPETAQPVISFCTTLCLLYCCHWPQEHELQDESASLLMALAKKGAFVRSLMVTSPSFEKIAALHSVCASLRHTASHQEVLTAMSGIGADLSIDVVRGYQRLPYSDRARFLTCLLIACSEMQQEKANAMFVGCLKAVETPFSTLVQALSNAQTITEDINVQESACLLVLLYGGVVRASEMSEPERIPLFITPSLPHLSGLMAHYARDQTICRGLLTLFRDYAEQYIAMMTREQSIDLFTSSASLLKHYSEVHLKNRVVQKRSETIEDLFEEEQNYDDVLCAIQLLIFLGTKDFTIICGTSTSSSVGVETSQITDVIFFGLQQVLPLMTQGMLQFPDLCRHYFSLVGFMMETYPEKLCKLPFDLFSSLLESLLFGMSHSDPLVAKSSLHGLASLAREHLRTNALSAHLSGKSDIVYNCIFRLIAEVIFQPVIWDRLEPAGAALLPLVAIDFQGFVRLVDSMKQQLGCADKQRRLQQAFETLIKPEMLAKVSAEGREGRFVRYQFKSDFNTFVREVQSFLIMK